MSSADLDIWIDKQGEIFLRDIGIKNNHVILDFGCSRGTYTIPAAQAVGENGRVYAVDRKQEVLHELAVKVKQKNLQNVELIDMARHEEIPLSDNLVDVILLFDVLHLVEKRTALLRDLFRVLKPQGILSVYPKHHQTDMNMSLAEVQREVEAVGFHFDVKSLKTLMHDDLPDTGYVLNFQKI